MVPKGFKRIKLGMILKKDDRFPNHSKFDKNGSDKISNWTFTTTQPGTRVGTNGACKVYIRPLNNSPS